MQQLICVAIACVLAVAYILVSAVVNHHDADTVKAELAVVVLLGGFYVLCFLTCWLVVGWRA